MFTVSKIITTMNDSFLKFPILILLGLLLTFGCAKTGKVGTVSKKDAQDQSPEPEMKKVEFGEGWKSPLMSFGLPKAKQREIYCASRWS